MSKVVKKISGADKKEKEAKKEAARQAAENARQEALNISRSNIEKTKEARSAIREQRVSGGSIVGGIGGSAPSSGQGILSNAPNPEGAALTYAQTRRDTSATEGETSPLPGGGQGVRQ